MLVNNRRAVRAARAAHHWPPKASNMQIPRYITMWCHEFLYNPCMPRRSRKLRYLSAVFFERNLCRINRIHAAVKATCRFSKHHKFPITCKIYYSAPWRARIMWILALLDSFIFVNHRWPRTLYAPRPCSPKSPIHGVQRMSS